MVDMDETEQGRERPSFGDGQTQLTKGACVMLRL